ncbi:acetyl-CoA synthetase-like protein [Melanomma pulvis-pyrius CBS 109.77]|uniref:Acetyl-CoA synthetase-like protein n=1 Tax=Melanomma pulvis-pyrius CBS 109.77 TaxID=1314802 RepID=A0A6A6X1A3_9PLEO|nr:acetyl-CoA synthetase-like protein [Melanomma pulvis-pyrius CBS 109.77]
MYLLDSHISPLEVSYRTLYELAQQNSKIIRSLQEFREKKPILLHLEDQWDTIVWFWSVILADGLPVLSSSLSHVDEHRQRYLEGLSKLLESPICFTREDKIPLFDGNHTFKIESIESMTPGRFRVDSPNTGLRVSDSAPISETQSGSVESSSSLAMLMLTSGSTGNPKAVCLTHQQVLAAVKGKASVRSLSAGRPFLNWIGLDHVASLVEIHLQAMWLGVDQVHVPAAAVVSSPKLFLDLLSRHRVSRSFAPNFFLAKLASTIDAEPELETAGWDLSSLTVLASGGELNDVETCLAASAIFESYGSPRNVITTGFGMTETCAGAIFNLECPGADVDKGRSVASLGKCMQGIEMRVTIPSAKDDSITIASSDEPGDLEVRGDVVFKAYYRNPEATKEAFTTDGWFRTGDQAKIDMEGDLHLIGRVKDVININGVKFSTSDIQTSVERAVNSHVGRVICFPSRAVHTEQVTVAYTQKEALMEPREMLQVEELISQTCVISTGSRPLVFSLQDDAPAILPVSALGKISRAKMTSLFQEGYFDEAVLLHRQTMESVQKQKQGTVATTIQGASPAEKLLIEDFIQTLGVPDYMVGLDTRIFDLGSTSMDLMRLQRRIDTRLGIVVPIILLMRNPTPRSLATSLQLNAPLPSDSVESSEQIEQSVIAATQEIEYEPIVTFSSGGGKTPLWLIHPGVGEVLVFVGLAQHLRADDRPVYALRARGFEAGQERFGSIGEAVQRYVDAIRQRQPRGPYALAGYSYGTMLAFEVAKRLDAADGIGAVQFLGSFNLPPHIKTRMRHLNWNICLLHLSWFLDLVSEVVVEGIDEHQFRLESRDDALEKLLAAASRERLNELGLGRHELVRWADVAFGLQSMAVDYDPSGQVAGIDVFHAIPLKVAAASREEWVEVHLSKWGDFSASEPRFHKVGGAHYTMIGPEHVSSFSQTLIEALHRRGL